MDVNHSSSRPADATNGLMYDEDYKLVSSRDVELAAKMHRHAACKYQALCILVCLFTGF